MCLWGRSTRQEEKQNQTKSNLLTNSLGIPWLMNYILSLKVIVLETLKEKISNAAYGLNRKSFGKVSCVAKWAHSWWHLGDWVKTALSSIMGAFIDISYLQKVCLFRGSRLLGYALKDKSSLCFHPVCLSFRAVSKWLAFLFQALLLCFGFAMDLKAMEPCDPGVKPLKTWIKMKPSFFTCFLWNLVIVKKIWEYVDNCFPVL